MANRKTNKSKSNKKVKSLIKNKCPWKDLKRIMEELKQQRAKHSRQSERKGVKSEPKQNLGNLKALPSFFEILAILLLLAIGMDSAASDVGR